MSEQISRDINFRLIGLYISYCTYVDVKSSFFISVFNTIKLSFSERPSLFFINCSHSPRSIEDTFGLLLFFCSSKVESWKTTFSVSN